MKTLFLKYKFKGVATFFLWQAYELLQYSGTNFCVQTPQRLCDKSVSKFLRIHLRVFSLHRRFP